MRSYYADFFPDVPWLSELVNIYDKSVNTAK